MSWLAQPSLFSADVIAAAGSPTIWPFGSLPPFEADLIMADPPWAFENYSDKGVAKGAKAQYDCMAIEDICALPVAKLAAENCLLWLWVTAPLLKEGLQVLEAWGFQYKTHGAWSKRTRTGRRRWGTGYVLRSCHETFLIATIGTPKTARDIPSEFEGRAREHSRKPAEGYALAERMLVMDREPRRVELFSRENRPGWQSWGNEAGKFNECPKSEDAPCSAPSAGSIADAASCQLF